MNEYEAFPCTSLAEFEAWGIKDSPCNFHLETEVYFETLERVGVVRPVREAGENNPPWGPLHVISVTQPGSEKDPEQGASDPGTFQ